jgi:hypothetical protein
MELVANAQARPTSESGRQRKLRPSTAMSPSPLIVLQKSKVAGLRIFAKNPKREAIAVSYRPNRVTEVAYEFSVAR